MKTSIVFVITICAAISVLCEADKLDRQNDRKFDKHSSAVGAKLILPMETTSGPMTSRSRYPPPPRALMKQWMCRRCSCIEDINKKQPRFCTKCCKNVVRSTVKNNRVKRGFGKKLRNGVRKIGKGIKKVAIKASKAFGGTIPVYKKNF